MFPLPCMLVCSFVCANRTRDRGCSKHPVFPAPSDFEEGKRRCKPRAKSAPREREAYVHRHCERSEAIHLSACSAMDCFAALAMTGRERCPRIRSPDERRTSGTSLTPSRMSLRSSGLQASLAMTRRELCHTGSAIEYFTWLSAKLDSIEAMPSSRVSLFFRNAS